MKMDTMHRGKKSKLSRAHRTKHQSTENPSKHGQKLKMSIK